MKTLSPVYGSKRTIEPVDSLLRDLRSLNYRFLLGLSAGRQTAVYSTDIVDGLRRLDRSALELIADCPYSLFDLRFEDGDHWRRCIDTAMSESDAGGVESVHVCDVAAHLGDLEEAAVFLAWSAVRIDKRFAQFAFGMDDGIVAMLCDTPIVYVASVKRLVGRGLYPRWLDNRCFWPDLLRFAGGATSAPLAAARLLGCQLTAARQPQVSARSARAPVTFTK